MGQQNIIELNGKQYDALSGALLGQSRVKATPASRAGLRRQGRAVDGFIRKGTANGPHPTVVQPDVVPSTKLTAATQPLHKQAGKSMGDVKKVHVARSGSKALAAHQPEHPKTLMRAAVKKPSMHLKPAIKTTAPAEMMAAPNSKISKPLQKKLSVTQVNPVRLGRAQRIARSQHIRRFREERGAYINAVSANSPRAAAVQTTTSGGPVVSVRSAATQAASRSMQQDFRPVQRTHQVTQMARPQASVQPATKPQSAADIFEAALAHATAHEQTEPLRAKRRASHRRRVLNLVAGISAVLLFVGFLAYLNRPAIELHLASMRVGFHADLPSYRPTGYALNGGVKTIGGDTVALNYASGDSSYTITQQASDWNSTTLLDQLSTSHGTPSQTVESKGRTIYIFKDATAAWVNGGVHYELSGNNALNSDEIVSVATSM